MAIGAKHVLLVAVATSLLTYAAFHGESSHSDTVSLQGRKSLPDPQFSETTPVLAEDSVTKTESDDTTEDATFETVEGDALTPINVESEETSEEATEEVTEEVSEEPAVEETEETTAAEDTTEEATTAEEAWKSEGNAEDVQTEENVDFSAGTQEESEEASEEQQVREMLDASVQSKIVENPDSGNYPKPKIDNPNIFLNEIAQDNMVGRQNEGFIQSCIKKDGCGTPDP